MDLSGWLQLALFCGLVWALTKPVGLYLVRVLEPDGRTWLDRPLRPVERLVYRILRTGPGQEQDWKQYARSLLLFSLIGLLFTYAVLRLQHLLPLNPQHLGPVRPDLAFNTAASFATNTNWQNYAGETTLSYFSQMVGLVFQNFVSAAAGIAAAAALVRGIARHSTRTVGNFWVDLVRINLYLLIPLSLVFSVFLASQGIVQNFKPSVGAVTVETRGFSDDRPRTGRFPGGHQDAGHQRRRLLQRQCRPSLRESHAALELPSDAGHLPGPERPDLLPGAEGQECTARLGGLERHGHLVPDRGPGLLAGRERRESPPGRGRRFSECRQHGRQGGPLRRAGFLALCHGHDGGLVRGGQQHARLVHPARRAGPAFQHPARRGRLRRRRFRPLRDAHLRRPGRLSDRAHGRADARVPRQEDRGLRRQGLRSGPSGHRLRHSRLLRLGFGRGLGAGRPGQCRPARPERDPLCLLVRGGQQRQRLRRPQRVVPLLQRRPGRGHAVRPFPCDRPRSGPGRQPGPQEDSSLRAKPPSPRPGRPSWPSSSGPSLSWER